MQHPRLRWALITAAIVFAACQVIVGEVLCPYVCVCYPNLAEASGTLTVDCRGQDLFEIPYPLPNTTSHLDVSNNEIEFIRIRDLQELPQLTYLQLQNNDITEIEPGAFREVENLERLVLYNNRIRHLRLGVFEGLGKLQSLTAYSIQLESYDVGVFDSLVNIVEIDLSFNSLESIPAFSFSGLGRLQRIILCDNYISNVEAQSVNKLPALLYLNLARNQLRVVTPRAFVRLPRIQTLALHGNPLECGCDAVWLFDFVTRRSLPGPTCEQPDSLFGQNLLSLTQDDFCALPTATIMALDDLVLPIDETLMLECDTTGAPPPDVAWSKDGLTFDPSDNRVNEMGETLVITLVNEMDSGMFHCTAASTAGTVADSVRVTVVDVGAQNFTMTMALLGASAELVCSDSIPPGVPVRWEVNGSTLTDPDKYVLTSNGSLVILDLKPEDDGLYECVVDRLSFTRQLEVQAPPTITQFPEGRCTTPSTIVVSTSETTNLTCVAFGIPPPTVQWIMEGVVQVDTPPSLGSTTGETVSVLELSRPLEEDSGNYSCRATNALGQDERVVSIDVNVILEVNVSRIVQLEVMVGSTVMLPCSVEGIDDPGAIVNWQRMVGLPLPSNSHITFDYQLVIQSITVADIAIYQCVVQTSSGVALLEYALLISEPPSISKFCAPIQMVVFVDDPVALLCDLLRPGSPAALVSWVKEGVGLISADDRITLLQGDQLLQIDPALEADSGLYTCLVGNRHGNDSYSIQLDVLRRPFFRHEPQDVVVTVGDTAMLQCAGTGSPPPVLTWWRVNYGGEPELVTSDNRVIVSDEFLVFLEVRESDEGTYYCNLTSMLLQLSSNSADLTVWTPPTINSSIAPSYIFLEGPVDFTISCEGTGDPPPAIHWLKDGEVLGFRDPGSRLDLWFKEVKEENAGVYTCRLANAAGEDIRETEVIVRSPPDTQVDPPIVEASVGCQVTLYCSDGGRVPEEFEWQYEGEMLVNRRNVLIRPTGELVISNAQVANSGVYTCEVRGIAGPASNSSILTVLDPLFSSTSGTTPPSLVSPTPPSQSIPIGQTAQFVCAFTGFPEPTIEWTRDNSFLPNLKRIDVVSGGGLTIRELRVTDTATYSCNVSNPLGTEILTFDLLVTEPPVFQILPSPLVITRVSPIHLECSARGSPPPVIVWLFNDALLPAEPRIVIDGGRLRIYNTSVNDSGLYTCLAMNNAGASQYTVAVTVNTLLIPPNITIPPESVTVMARESVILDCIADGFPLPQITWLKDGEALNTTCIGGEVECVIVDGPSLMIQRSEEWDTGRYTCIAENEAGRAVYEVFVTVLSLEIIPFFIVYPQSVWVVEGSLVSIDCRAAGLTLPNITWLKGFEEFNNTDELHVLDNGTLVIPQARLNDSAMYVCRASNEAGVNQIMVAVDVVSNLTNGSRPSLVTFPILEVMLNPGQSQTLDCVAEGNPTPSTQWLLDGQPLDYPDLPNVYRAPNDSLVINNVTELDAGVYSCLAVNSLGSAEAFVRITVAEGIVTGLEANTQPHLVLPGKQEALVGSEVMVDCQAEGEPEPYILWTHDDKPVYESEMVSVASNGSLIIRQVHPTHGGRYTCHAADRLSLVVTDMLLAITPRKEPPHFTKVSESLRALASSHFILHCEAVDPTGPVGIRWMDGAHSLTMDAGRMEVLPDGGLLVTGVRPSDGKDYTCQAQNDHGVSTAIAHVTVLGLPLNGTVRAKVGAQAHVHCGGGGEGFPLVWERNGRPLPNDSRLDPFQSDLQISAVLVEDEGEYTCYRGDTVLNYYLEVSVAPEITHFSRVVRTAAASTAALHCVATGKPHPLVTWQHGGKELKWDSQYSTLSNGTLLVYGVTKGRDEGRYVCRAENVAGVNEVSVKLLLI